MEGDRQAEADEGQVVDRRQSARPPGAQEAGDGGHVEGNVQESEADERQRHDRGAQGRRPANEGATTALWAERQ